MTDESSLELEYLSNLKFYDDRLEYKGVARFYRDIVGVKYYAVRTKHSVNFIPVGESHEAYILLRFADDQWVSIDQERRMFRKEQRTAEAVMRAAEIISEITFTERYERYEKQFSTKSYVDFDGFQLHKDGDVFKNNKRICSITDQNVSCRLAIFECLLSFKAPSLFGLSKTITHTIDLRYNRDCFVRFARDAYGLTWKDERLREKRKRVTETDVQRSIVKLCAKLCKVDGRVTPDEVDRIKEYFGITEKTLPGATELFRDFVGNSLSGRTVAQETADYFRGNPEALRSILIGLIQIAIADGELHPAEERFLQDVAAVFAIDDPEFKAIMQALRADFGSTRDSQSFTDLDMCYQILGLSPGATLEAIKAAYRNKARMHHPDILRSTGVDIERIREGERMLIIINRAYETLSKKLQ